MFPLLLHTHSILRYLVLLLLAIVIVRFTFGKIFKRQYNSLDDRLSLFTVMIVHLQFLIGAILYFISPTVKAALSDMAAAMKDEILRFWAVEHVTLMAGAVLLITIGRIKSKKQALHSEQKFRRALIFYVLGLVFIIAGIPWER
ncbi:MAG TPA: hypothetical protein VNJ07_12070 [Chitinophagales bacterium]|nr:hypothetical protein [Chitinophagales bacterium]